ncbi:hypothetical protein SLS54_010682 [Diplodia seriata]
MPRNTIHGVSPDREASQLQFLHRQLCVTPPAVSPASVNLRGRTAIVTGANVGLGLECSRQLMELGLSRLILAVRDEAKGQAAREDLTEGVRTFNIDVWKLDMSSYGSIIAFVDRCKALPALDVVVLNAGVAKATLDLNPSTGHDEVVQVNYLSTALLTLLLLPVVQSKAQPQRPGRIVVVNSETAAWAAFKERSERPLLPAFDQPGFFDRQDRYYTSKLLGQLFLAELAKRVPPSVAVVNAVNPGLCYGSALHRDANSGITGALLAAFKRAIGRSTAVGARTLTDAAASHGEDTHGQYLGDCKLKPMAPLVYTEEGQKVAGVLWEETMAELSFAHVQDIITQLSQ